MTERIEHKLVPIWSDSHCFPMLSAMSRIMWKPKMWIGQGALSVELMWAVHTNSVQLKVLKVGAKAHCCTKNTIHTYSYYKYCVAYHIYIYMCVCVLINIHINIYIHIHVSYVCVCVSAANVKRKTMDLKASERFVQFFQCSMLRQASNRLGSKHCFPQYRCLLLGERHLSSASNTQTSQSNLATAENSINRCAFCRIVVVVSSNIGLYFSHPTSSINSKLRKNKWPKDCVQCSSIVPQPAIKAWRRAE